MRSAWLAGSRSRRVAVLADLVSAPLVLGLVGLANAQAPLEPDELIVHPEPKDPDFFRSRRDGWFWLNDPSIAKREKKAEQPPDRDRSTAGVTERRRTEGAR